MTAEALKKTDTYQRGYADALEDMRKRQEQRRRRQQERRAKRWYFIKQKLSGFLLLIFTVLAVIVLDGDATIAVITVPMGLYLIFSKEMWIVNNYYWEKKERATYEKRGSSRRVRL